eukprot:TRINITY_DN4906_c0_g1_i1.p1 TRINITY_DN4906_c0_g1~~TRINITY_DN4906_c0_g1_i1.p1  ORF type:complete len:489 (-),score=85.72 TRINITY_DN4906_c0_g1_i1:113-1579(-)
MKNMNKLLALTLSLLALLIATAECKKPLLKDGLFKKFRFIPQEDFTDEFKGRRFDLDKWYDINPRWKGRQPGLFATKNVRQRKGELRLRGRYETSITPFVDAPEGYGNYTTAFVQTRKKARYGYFEVRAKPSNSRLSSSFWGSLDTPKLWTEIDVYEIGGGAVNNGVDFRKRINMNLHVFRNERKGIVPGENEISKPTYYTHSKKLRSKFNTYGLDWNKRYITWTFNGRAIRKDRNYNWKQAFPMKFDVETMPYWFGLPSKDTLPAVYKIKYIRAWRKKRKKNNDDESKSTERQLSTGLLPVSSLTLGADSSDVGNDDDEEESDMEIEDMNSEPETVAPVDGLQRPPIEGSNERVYEPVLPFGGGSWAPFVEQMNMNLGDVAGTIFDSDEHINLADFEDELVNFGNMQVPTMAAGGEQEEEEEGEEGSNSDASGDASSNAAGIALPFGSLGRPDRPSSTNGGGVGGSNGGRGFGRIAGGLKLPGFGGV